MEKQLQKVEFYGDELMSVRDEEGRIWVSLSKLCKNLSIDGKNQREKVKNDPRFTVGGITLTAADGKNYKMLCLPVDEIQGWLFSINATKIRPEFQAKLITYQKECVQVLNEYWTKGASVNPRALNYDIENIINEAIQRAVKATSKEDTITIKTKQAYLVKAEVSLYGEITKSFPTMSAWAEQCTRIELDHFHNNQLRDTSKDPFFLSDIFRELNFTNKQATIQAQQFGKLKEVQQLCVGQKEGIIRGSNTPVNYYFLQDYPVLKDLAIKWLSNKEKKSAQKSIFIMKEGQLVPNL